MAKKKTKATVKETVVEQVVEQPIETIVAPPKPKVQKEVKPSWEIKDRVYYLTSQNQSLFQEVYKSSGYLLV